MFKEVKDLQKYLLFISGIICVIGFIVAGGESTGYNYTSASFLVVKWVKIWSWFSAPFIIMLLYNVIFRKK